MENNIIYIAFLCITVPMLFLFPIIKDKFARTVVGYVIVGVFCCLLVAEINGYILRGLNMDYEYVTTAFTPITEEIIKALPVLFFAFVFTDSREKLLSVGFALGVGFAILENIVILLQNFSTVSLLWALLRGFGAALMHGVCTGVVGLGLHFIHQKKKLFIPGSFALLVMSMTYHSIYNTLVQSQYKYFGFVLPLITFVILFFITFRSRRKAKNKKVQTETVK